MIDPQSTPAGIPNDLLRHIREALLQCDALQSNATTRTLFADGELASWKHGVYEAGNAQERVGLLIELLHDQWTISGVNALVLLLRALAGHLGPADALAHRLVQLATELAGGDAGALLPQDPQARLAAMPTDKVPPVAPLPPQSRMPLRPNPLFVGRDNDLRGIARSLKGKGTTLALGQSTAIQGIGGVGKTQTGIEYVHRYGRYFAGGVFWLNFADADGVRAEVASCGSAEHLALHPGFSSLGLEDQVRLVRAAWQQPIPRLLIFDNCEEEAPLDEWLPRTGGCRVLVTSRRGSWSLTLGVQCLVLGTLRRAESIELLRKFRPDLPEEDETLDQIAAVLGDLPLALHLAGSYLKSYQEDSELGNPAIYLHELTKTSAVEHLSLQGEGAEWSPTQHELDISRTFQISYERLNPDTPLDLLALLLLVCASYLAPGVPIPRELLRMTFTSSEERNTPESRRQLSKALKRLVALGLIEEEAEGSVVLHQLVALFVQRAAGGEAVQQVVELTLLKQASYINSEGYPMLLLGWQAHLRHVVDRAQNRNDERASRLCNILGSHLYMIGDYEGARPYIERALVIHEVFLGTDHPEAATTLSNMGYIFQAAGDYATARPYFERALAICETTLGPEHPATASSLNGLGYLLRAAGDYESARICYERALAVREASLGPEHPDTASSLNNLGQLLKITGDYIGARSYFERAGTIREAALGPQHPDIATNLNNLAGLLYVVGNYVDACPYYERALAIREQVLGPDHPDTAESLNNLAALLQATGDYATARIYYERALAIREQVLGPQHPTTASSLNNLAALLQATGDYEGAQVYFVRALAIYEQILGPQHPDTATGLSNLACILQTLGDYTAARIYYERALAIREKILGPQHPTTASSLNNLATLLSDLGDSATAQAYFVRALAIYEQVLGPQHPDTASSLNSLAALLHNIGDYATARPYYERALAIREQILGPQHPDTASSLSNLATLLKATGADATARPYYERALAIREQVLGSHHPDTARSLNSLAVLLHDSGDYVTARPYYERALAIREQVLGPQHPDTASSLSNLAVLLHDRGDYATARLYYERALAIYEGSLGPTHATTQIIRQNLEELMNKLRDDET